MFPAGLHPVLVRLAGFRGHTVPVLKIDGKRVETSLAIARELERIKPDPPLYPADAEARARVEDAERWGEAELQPVPRRIIRWALTEQRPAREWMARHEQHAGAGAPGAHEHRARAAIRERRRGDRGARAPGPRRTAGQARPRGRAARRGHPVARPAQRRHLPDRHHRSARSASSRSSTGCWRAARATSSPTPSCPTSRRRPSSFPPNGCRCLGLDLDVADVVALDDRDLRLIAVVKADDAPERAPLLDLDPGGAVHRRDPVGLAAPGRG